jgi:rhamnosyltransferase
MTTVGVAVITHNAKHHLTHCLPPLLQSPLEPKVLVVNSSSEDGTVKLAREMGAETLIVAREEFNHGLTRNLALQQLNTDVTVFVTPDAYALDCHMLSHLIQPIVEKKASLSYARQLPHIGAGFFERYSRDYNYSDKSHIRGIEDIASWGAYIFFISNSCAAYLTKALKDVGGFSNVLLGEDTLAASKMLARGHKIAYCAEAIVRHSHSYTLKQEFQRAFDTGIARKLYENWPGKNLSITKYGGNFALFTFGCQGYGVLYRKYFYIYSRLLEESFFKSGFLLEVSFLHYSSAPTQIMPSSKKRASSFRTLFAN